MSGSIRRTLLQLVLLPLVGVLPILGVGLLWWSDSAIDELLVTKVRSDLAVAHGYFERVLAEVGGGTRAVAESQRLHAALASLEAAQAAGSAAASQASASGQRPAPSVRQRQELQALLQHQKERLGLSFLNWRDPEGRLVVSDWSVRPPDGGAWAGSEGGDAWAAQVRVLDRSSFAALAPALLDQLSVPLVDTQGARHTDRRVEDRAMVALAQASVTDSNGRVLGHLQGGILLNRNLEFIDRINDIVYPQGALPFGSKGTATLFLDDVRISTNVRLFSPDGRADEQGPDDGPDPGARAIGTRVSERVHQQVLDEGKTWLGRAFVVNQWYVSAYEPIVDTAGRRLGMLYVGFLERPYQTLKYAVLAGIGVLFFAVMVVASWLSLRTARGIFQPIEQMELTMRRVEAGEAQARVGPVAADDEIGRLARDLDHLLDTIADKTRALEAWNAELDARVHERTAALKAAQEQLVRSEKLVVIGQLTAGMAHEINNPIAVIQGNLDLLRMTLGPHAESLHTELSLIDQQIDRMRLIVSQMLQFARPSDYAAHGERVDPAAVLKECLPLTEHTLRSRGVSVLDHSRLGLQAHMQRQELQQVLINLLVNAAHAMPHGGQVELHCHAHRWEDGGDGVAITVADQGPGLPESVRHGLFQPFVTHKKDGTGLGLWISRTLVERYGGDLRGANRNDGRSGAVFTVLLRSQAHPAANADQVPLDTEIVGNLDV